MQKDESIKADAGTKDDIQSQASVGLSHLQSIEGALESPWCFEKQDTVMYVAPPPPPH